MNRKRLRCLLRHFGHDFEFVRRTDDWLNGGEYTYVCTRCEHSYTTRPYQGGSI